MGSRPPGDEPTAPEAAPPAVDHRLLPPEGEETEFPPLDIYETPEEFVIEAELPGVDPARVEVVAGAGLIVIQGVKAEELEVSRVHFLCMERSFGAFRRLVHLSRAVDLFRVAAVYREGVLRVRVPKVSEKRGRHLIIPVRAEEPSAEGAQP